MCEVTLITQQSKPAVNNILDQTTKPELAKYLHAVLFSPTITSLLEAIKKGLLKKWMGFTEGLIKKCLVLSGPAGPFCVGGNFRPL